MFFPIHTPIHLYVYDKVETIRIIPLSYFLECLFLLKGVHVLTALLVHIHTSIHFYVYDKVAAA